jgi:hypothetical protein
MRLKMNFSEIINILKKTKTSDLKDIDIGKLQSVFWGQPRNVIFALMIVITSIISWKIYNHNIRQSQVLAEDIPSLNKKLEVVKKQETIKKEISDLIKSAPAAMTSDEMIDFITETSGKMGLQIISLSPAKVTKDETAESTNIEFDISSDDYKAIVLFVKEIEKSDHALKVQRWEGRMEDNISRSKNSDRSVSNFIAKIEIASVDIHE